jgi:UDP-N-acetylmuramate dehydrogenase
MMEDLEATLRKEFGGRLETAVNLSNFVSIKVGGVADYFFRAKNIEDLVSAVSIANKLQIPYFILGGGYNIVPSDSGFPGLVIKNESNSITFSPDFSTVIVDSGVNLSRLINLAASRDLGGLEFLFGVPGTVGGAVYGNAGAFKHEIGDFIKSVTVLELLDNKIVLSKYDKKWMGFDYRTTKLKEYTESHDSDTHIKPVILTVTVQLVQRRRDEILRMMQENLKEKKKHQPLTETSAGSFFKNIDSKSMESAAGYLLDKAGAKKLRVGGAAFSAKHANFLINRKKATANDIRNLAEMAKVKVKEKFEVELEEEIEYIGRW